MGGGGGSKRYSWLDTAAGCFTGALDGLSYSQVLAARSRALEARASREANFGIASQALADSVNSLSRAAMAAITRFANHGRAIAASEVTFLKISLLARMSWAASRQRGQEARWARSATDKSPHNSSTLAAEERAPADSSSKSIILVQRSSFLFSRFHIPASLLLWPSSSISAFPGLADDPPPRPEK